MGVSWAFPAKWRKQSLMRECTVGVVVALAGSIWNVQKSCGRCSWRGNLRPGQHGSKARSSYQSWIKSLCAHLFLHSFNKNVSHAKPLPGAVPLDAGHTVGRATSAFLRPVSPLGSSSAMGKWRLLPSPG